mmetsp:Transcript_1360/g.4029  ORF Transcript_1360/g.4029 Transcript_1360/m.4029 type:complete len:185 (+) Transcript_1360:1931-2485(+)
MSVRLARLRSLGGSLEAPFSPAPDGSAVRESVIDLVQQRLVRSDRLKLGAHKQRGPAKLGGTAGRMGVESSSGGCGRSRQVAAGFQRAHLIERRLERVNQGSHWALSAGEAWGLGQLAAGSSTKACRATPIGCVPATGGDCEQTPGGETSIDTSKHTRQVSSHGRNRPESPGVLTKGNLPALFS